MDFSTKPNGDTYAVVGNPISHSVSPLIHSLFAEQLGQTIDYSQWELRDENFSAEVKKFFRDGGGGLNVTSPFKGRAYSLCDELSLRAQIAQAVNTLYYSNGKLQGENTDGPGLVADLQRLNWTIAGKRILIVGAGGAVSGVLQALIEQAPSSITIINRTAVRAENLCALFSKIASTKHCQLKSDSLEMSVSTTFDLVINGTTSSVADELPAIDARLVDSARCYDMYYAAAPTRFLAWAAGAGALSLADGLGMLVGQAAESFKIWRGVAPEVEPVLAVLRTRMQARP